jgi:hypothetical protein
MQKITAINNASIYNSRNELILSNAQAAYALKIEDNEITVNLTISCTDDNLFSIGESYYATNFSHDGAPFRSETVECIKTGNNPRFEWKAKFPAEKSDTSEPLHTNAGADEKFISMQFTNYSSQEFERDTWGANLWDGFSWLTNSPGDTLDAHSGQQEIAASQNFDSIISFNSSIWLCWKDKWTNFGVWIHFNYQILGMGDAPIWYVTTNGEPWVLAGANPAEPFVWDASKVDLKIVARPTAGHSSLFVDVIIEDTRT